MPPSALPLPAPLSGEQGALLARFADTAPPAALLWASGYLAGLARAPLAAAIETDAGSAQAAAPAGAHAPAPVAATVVYGSQNGNARRVAEALHAALQAAGVPARLLRADAYPLRALATERLLYVVISTQGDGDPPDDAIALCEFLHGKRAPRLPQLHYAVLGLGDSSYADFCGVARRLDARLAELGATRAQALGEADLDIDAVAAPWQAQALERAQALLTPASSPAPQQPPLASVTPLRPPSAQERARPQAFAAEVLANQRITGREFKGTGFRRYQEPEQDVRHIELALDGSGLDYAPGDALAIHHRNPLALVDAVLDATRLDGDAEVAHADRRLPLARWLEQERELTRLSRLLLAALAERAGAADLRRLLDGDGDGLAALLRDHQVIDVLRRWPADWDAPALLAALRAPARRLYSIASSRTRVGEEAHLAVAVVRYAAHGHDHLGAASGFLAEVAAGARVEVALAPNERFRLPADGDRDLLMVAAGTGIAPFRGFVQERAETGARGRNWLFFGARNPRTGFLYQAEWQQALRRGELHRLELAFSRAQPERIHVQQRLREHGRAVYARLQEGAHLYVCGATAMGRDVHAALLEIVADAARCDADAAADYLAALQRDGRYARDLY